jgi:hypothetical protein
MKEYYHFIINLDNFFVTCGRAIISMCRELWNGYSLNPNSDRVNFYYIRQQFKYEFKII